MAGVLALQYLRLWQDALQRSIDEKHLSQGLKHKSLIPELYHPIIDEIFVVQLLMRLTKQDTLTYKDIFMFGNSCYYYWYFDVCSYLAPTIVGIK